MKIRHPLVIAALALPLVCLTLLATYKQVQIMSGAQFTIPIVGFDPRDLLAGHYLTYRLDFGNDRLCARERAQDEPPAEAVLLCLRQARGGSLTTRVLADYQFSPPALAAGCDAVLKARCEYGRVLAGVERFYVPEEHAAALDRLVRSHKGKIVISVDRFGTGTVKDLLLNDRPWRAAIANGGN